MYLDDDKHPAGYYCDAQVGSIKKGWRTCQELASIQVKRESIVSQYSHTVDYCRQHESRQQLDTVGRILYRNRSRAFVNREGTK